ncbi:hypothetical protein [Ferrimonas marina]|uniref:Uncharacterized protein n=1 Tax=Ferrimonas marina TaxID=299255 RepID=A0A1M5U9E3_9GAMM|nr:hypothetical protein [Ferrimonas marina]SHH59652.1 hypothetical protein SAMN02745129_2466 [Ferrimonas marina]
MSEAPDRLDLESELARLLAIETAQYEDFMLTRFAVRRQIARHAVDRARELYPEVPRSQWMAAAVQLRRAG